MSDSNLEQRMVAVEQAVQELKLSVQERKPAPDWLARVIGSMQDEPDFEQVVALGAEIRRADRPAEETPS